MLKTIILLLVLALLIVPIEKLYLFTLTGARQKPANFFEKWCVHATYGKFPINVNT